MKRKKLLALILSLVFIIAITTPVLAAPAALTISGVKTTKAEYDSLEVTGLGCGISISVNQNNNPVITIDAGAEPGILTLITKDQDGNNTYLKFVTDTLDYQEGAKLTLKVQTSLKAIAYSFEHTQHVAGDMVIVSAADCVNDGFWEIRCKFCGELLDTDVIAAFGHDFAGENDALSYSETLGKWVYTCRTCGCDEFDNFAALSGVPNGGFLAPWEGPGARPVYDSAAWINYLPASPISGDVVQNSRLYYPVGDDVPDELPLLVFFHGYETGGSTVANVNKFDYLGRNLARNGYLVVIAAHQSGTSAAGGGFNGYMRNGANIINQTVAYLSSDNATGYGLARDDEGQPVYGIMGYSMGGILSMNLASSWETGRTYYAYSITMIIIPVSSSAQTQDPIPKPGFVYALELSSGGGTNNYMQSGSPIGNRGGYWADMDDDIYVVMSTGSGLNAADRNHALSCWNAINHIPASHKQFIGWNADTKTGASTAARIAADHTWPPTNNMNALHHAWIRTVSALANTAFYGTDKEYWYYDDFMFMGVWWDGTAIKPASISHANDLTNNGFWL